MYVRLFRHTGYESILEGEITETGVGFVMKRRLETLRNLFNFRRRRSTLPPPPPASSDSVQREAIKKVAVKSENDSIKVEKNDSVK